MANCYDMLQYDIPELQGEDRVRNPSYLLRRYAVRTSFSVWVVPHDRVPWALLDSWTHAGVRWHLVPFAAEAADQILALATDTLRREIDAIKKSADKSVADATAKLATEEAEAQSDTARRVARELFDKRARAICRRAERLLIDAESAARCFGMDTNGLPLTSSRTAIGALQSAAHQRASLYVALTHQVAGSPLEEAAKNSEVPPGVLADFIEDRGGDTTGVRETFDPPAPPAPPISSSSWGGSSAYGANGTAVIAPPMPAPIPAPLPRPQPAPAPRPQPRPEPRQQDERCPRCGAGLTQPKNGRFGLFRGCVRFPVCRGLVNLR